MTVALEIAPKLFLRNVKCFEALRHLSCYMNLRLRTSSVRQSLTALVHPVALGRNTFTSHLAKWKNDKPTYSQRHIIGYLPFEVIS